MKDSCPPKVAVVTGRHGFDVPHFHRLFRSLSDVDVYIQHMEMFSSSPTDVREGYDVVLFYHMLIETPLGESEKKVRAALEGLGAASQGILVLHHSILAYPDWALWDEIVGIEDRRFEFFHDVNIHVDVTDADHPISRGLTGWDMIDETYTMNSAAEGSEIILTVDHPQSMKTIAWTRRYKNSRVFCLESGHDNQTWINQNFREVLRRGIQWCAGGI